MDRRRLTLVGAAGLGGARMHTTPQSTLHKLQHSAFGLPVTWPLSALYGAVVRGRRALYDSGLWTSQSAPGALPVISVGGLEAGGSGKTPTAAYLLRHLLLQGRRPGLLTRGFGRTSEGLVIRPVGGAASPQKLGDEPAMLVHSGLDVPIAACAQRVVGADALASLGCQTLVLDDGFAHRALARALDIVVLRGEAPFGNGCVLPRGNLREPVTSLRRADVLWLNYRRGAPPPEVPEQLQARFADKLFVMAELVPSAPYDAAGVVQDLKGARVVAAAGIARPQDFLYHLTQAGADVRDFIVFRDHHAFDGAQMASLYRRTRASGAMALVVTAKDAIKLLDLQYPGNLWICDTDVVIHHGADALHQTLQATDLPRLLAS